MGNVPHDAVADKMFKEMSAVLILHEKTWHETAADGITLHCECGYQEVLKSEAKAAKVIAKHRSSELTEKVKKIAACAWDEGWFDREESMDPVVAGIFINPYRPVRGFFSTDEQDGNG